MPKSNAQDRGDLSAVARGHAVRTRLLTAAADLIGEIGWNAVSTRNLAERAGVGPGLVHYHFDSLQALLRQAALAQMRHVLEEVNAAVGESGDLAGSLEAMLSQLDDYTGADPSSLLVIEAYLAATRDPELHTQMAELMLGWRTAVSEALSAAGHPHPEAAAALLLAALDGLFLQKGLDPDLSHTQVAPLLRQLIQPETTGGNR
ncbi:TetR/AcrR family transcriptional regulator [Ruania zhangjianzhongii]|uniref:TetR/AcrR family transcriptional regulator n=1 Tax=Ruania zhangjianzhongii TaxID=2603206 RepID=UPI0011CBF59C|nr:TetR/AcrR family transcriptional regulator [Ruania zhangjianzhongii]